MIFLEFLRLTNTSRRGEVKERVDPLTKYGQRVSRTIPPLEADRSPSTVGLCQTVYLPSLYRPYTAKIREIYTATVVTVQWRSSGTTPCSL